MEHPKKPTSKEGDNVMLTLDQAFHRLFTLRDRWPFYCAQLKEPGHQFLKKRDADLTYAAKLWLLDAYYRGHDYLNRTLIKARKITAHYPPDIQLEDVKEEVIDRISDLVLRIKILGYHPDSALLSIQTDSFEEIKQVADKYFEAPEAWFQSMSKEELRLLLQKLSFFLADEEIFMSTTPLSA